MCMSTRPADRKVLVSSPSKARMMHATPSNNSTAMIGKDVTSKFVKTAMLTLVEVEEEVSVEAVVVLAAALAEACVAVMEAVAASVAEEALEEDMVVVEEEEGEAD